MRIAKTAVGNAQTGVSNAKVAVSSAKIGVISAKIGVIGAKIRVRDAQTAVMGAQIAVSDAQIGVRDTKIGVSAAKIAVLPIERPIRRAARAQPCAFILPLVEWAADRQAGTVHHMAIDLGRADVLVAEKLLYGANILSVLEQVSRKAVPEHMRSHTLRDPRLPGRRANGTL